MGYLRIGVKLIKQHMKRRGMYTYQASIPSNYKVCLLFTSGHISTTNHSTFREAASEMYILGASFCNAEHWDGGKETWSKVKNIWIEER